MEAVLKCMELMGEADKIVNGLENEDQLIMLLGTMTDKWFAKNHIDEENAVRILELLVEMHKQVFEAVGPYNED